MRTKIATIPRSGWSSDSTERYRVEVDLSRGEIVLGGDLDAKATDTLASLLGGAETHPRTIQVFADAVTGLDLTALDPLLQAARRRERAGLPGIVLMTASAAVVDLLATLPLPEPPVEL